MSKRILCILLACLMVLGCCACGGKENSSSANKPAEVDQVPALPPLDLSGLDVTEEEAAELQKAYELGILTEPDKLTQADVRGKDVIPILDAFIQLVCPEKYTIWESMLPDMRGSDQALSRLEVMAAIFLAGHECGGDYYHGMATEAWRYSSSNTIDWFQEIPFDYVLFGTWGDNIYTFSDGVVDLGIERTGYNYIVGHRSLVSGKSLFDLDVEEDSFHPFEQSNYLETVLAVLRLYESADLPVYETLDQNRLTQAVAMGIADGNLLNRLDEPISRGRMIEMLTKAHNLKYGWESQYLRDAASWSPNDYCDRQWCAFAIYHSEMENYLDEEYQDIFQWVDYCDQNAIENPIGWTRSCGALPIVCTDGTYPAKGLWGLDIITYDLWSTVPEGMEGLMDDCSWPMNYVALQWDRTTGEKIMPFTTPYSFQVHRTMTVGEGIQTALRFYNSIEICDMVPYDQVTDYDHSIITDDLLTKFSNLPDVSCQYLPADWNGMTVSGFGPVSHMSTGSAMDRMFYEGDFDIVKEAGFQRADIAIDLSWFQGYEHTEGMINEARLKQLDQVIAWCMERDIHARLINQGVGGCHTLATWDEWLAHNENAINGTYHTEEFATLWGVLARRYQDIPNKYLSFKLLAEPHAHGEADYARFFTPAVEAIREYTPDRLIFACIHSADTSGESMAKLGVALCYHLYEPRNFCVVDANEYKDVEYLATVTWPYEGINAQDAFKLSLNGLVSPSTMLETARKYGVAMIIGEFGVFHDTNGNISQLRYPLEVTEAYLEDMTTAFKDNGIPWNWGTTGPPYGITSTQELFQNTTYSPRANTNQLVDVSMMEIFHRVLSKYN